MKPVRRARRSAVRNGATVSLLLRQYTSKRSIPSSLRSLNGDADIADVWQTATLEQMNAIIVVLLATRSIDPSLVSRAVIDASRVAADASPATPEKRVVSAAFDSAVGWLAGRANVLDVLRELRRCGEVDVRRDPVAAAMWASAKSVVRFDSVDPEVLYEAKYMDDGYRETYLAKMADLHSQESLNELSFVSSGKSRSSKELHRVLCDTIRRHVTSEVVLRGIHAMENR